MLLISNWSMEYVSTPLECHILALKIYTSWKTQLIDGDTFENFCRKCLIPLLMPFNGINTHLVFVMDNCSVHHVNNCWNDSQYWCTPSLSTTIYSPDINPIELVFSQSFRQTNWSFHIYPAVQFQWLLILLLNKTAYITCNIHSGYL